MNYYNGYTYLIASLYNASTSLDEHYVFSNVIIDDSYLDKTTFTLITNASAPNNSAASKLHYDKTKRNEKDALKILQTVARESSNKNLQKQLKMHTTILCNLMKKNNMNYYNGSKMS